MVEGAQGGRGPLANTAPGSCNPAPPPPTLSPLSPLLPQGEALSISILVQQLGVRDAALTAVQALADMAGLGADNCANIAAAGAVSPVVALSGAASSAEVQAAAWALRAFADNADNRRQVGAGGAVPPLVALLGARSPAAVKEQAADALSNLAL